MTLHKILGRFAETNYENLFTPTGGFLSFDGKKWKVIKQRPKQTNIDELTRALVSELNSPECQLENKRALIKKVNALNPFQLPRNIPDEIHFSSKSKEYSCFSNFYPTLLQLDDDPTVYTSSEVAYQTLKQKFCEEENQLPEVDAPLKAKKMGRKLEVAQDDKLGLMARVLRAKFTQNPSLSEALRSTKEAILVEATRDEFWGKGSGNGQNQLGKLLMELRGQLTSEFI